MNTSNLNKSERVLGKSDVLIFRTYYSKVEIIQFSVTIIDENHRVDETVSGHFHTYLTDRQGPQ